MREFFQKIARALDGGAPVELVSVLRSGGSTPRGAGAMMAVFPDGTTAGTIGGGNVEYEAQQLAAELLNAGGDALRRFRFRQGDAAGLGMVCGGDVDVQFQYLPGGPGPAAEVFGDLVDAAGRDLDTWLVRRVEDGRVTAMGTADRNGPRRLPAPPEEIAPLLTAGPVWQGEWTAVPVVRAGRVYVFGGGHVSRALTPVLAAVGFRVTVLDDRPEFADPARFPAAEQVMEVDFCALSGAVSVGPGDYVVIMTRGHQADYEVLAQTLRSGARYIGCIGSRQKLALCRDRLLENGFTAEEYAAVHAPIGLNIGAETPEEIAVSVAAELIAVRAGREIAGMW